MRDPHANLASFGEITTAIDPALHFGAGAIWALLALVFLCALAMCTD